jgi:hypothetical protein
LCLPSREVARQPGGCIRSRLSGAIRSSSLIKQLRCRVRRRRTQQADPAIFSRMRAITGQVDKDAGYFRVPRTHRKRWAPGEYAHGRGLRRRGPAIILSRSALGLWLPHLAQATRREAGGRGGCSGQQAGVSPLSGAPGSGRSDGQLDCPELLFLAVRLGEPFIHKQIARRDILKLSPALTRNGKNQVRQPSTTFKALAVPAVRSVTAVPVAYCSAHGWDGRGTKKGQVTSPARKPV